MKTYLDCYPCFLKQAIQAGRFVTNDEIKLKQIVDTVASWLPNLPDGCTPPRIGKDIHRLVREITGAADPYREAKNTDIAAAKLLFDDMKAYVEQSDDRLAAAAQVAIAGNIIDYAANHTFDIASELKELVHRRLAIDSNTDFRNALEAAESVLYLGDNAGESVFDRILIEEIDAAVHYAVRGIPVLNDVTVEDAQSSGLNELATIVSSGTQAPGTLLDQCTDEFLELFHRADVVISKGQGNYEGLSETDRPVFFLLMAKCPVIAEDLGVDLGSLILMGLNTQTA